MDVNTFISKFADIFDDTDVSALRPETNFRELDEWSSLSALGVISLADEEFGVELSIKDMREANTIQELYDIITKK